MTRVLPRSLTVVVALLTLLLGVGVSRASADSIVFNLTTPNNTLSGFAGPYEQVTVNRTSPTTATITFDALTDPITLNTYLMGDGGAADVNVNATTWTLSGLSGTNSFGNGFTAGAFSNGGSGNVDSFGVFNQTINDFDGFSHSATQIVFTLTNTSGTWSSAANVLTPNSSGATAAAHIFVCGNPCTASGGALATGFASNGPGVVPEPATMSLFGTGLVLAGRAYRRRRAA